jgi:hypothetical protein
MYIFPKKDIIPIIVPQICFRDKFNEINSYIEMNPSLFIDENGHVTILVRAVNYKKFHDKQFKLYHQTKSISIYYILNGTMNGSDKLDIENFDCNLLEYNYNLPTFFSYWLGIEDIRFIDANTILTIIPELNEKGNPSIFKAELLNNKISAFTSCKPNKTEKNWLPYFDTTNNDNKVIYSLNPFVIKSIETDDREELQINEIIKDKLKDYHGSTNGIILDENENERLFLIHVNKERTYHRWLMFNIKTKNVSVSDEFVFFKNSYIEFNCSLCKYNNRIFTSIGLNDDKAFIIEVCYEDITRSFQ